MKTLIGILGEVPQELVRTQKSWERDERAVETGSKADAGGRTLEAWLEELEKDKLARLSKDIERRTSSSLTGTDLRNRRSKSIQGIANVNHCMSISP